VLCAKNHIIVGNNLQKLTYSGKFTIKSQYKLYAIGYKIDIFRQIICDRV